MGAVRRRRFHQHRARLHVLARLHPGAALPPEHLPDRCDDAQQASAARAGGRGEIPARRELRDEHEQGDRHDRPLLWRTSCARAASRARAHRAGERAIGRAQHAVSLPGAEGEDEGRLTLRLIAAALLAVATAAAAQTYPSKPLRVIVPQPPGGGFDLVARTLAEPLAALLGQAVVVENRPGGGAVVGTDVVAKSDPDGYTILLGASANLVFSAGLYRNLPYD